MRNILLALLPASLMAAGVSTPHPATPDSVVKAGGGTKIFKLEEIDENGEIVETEEAAETAEKEAAEPPVDSMIPPPPAPKPMLVREASPLRHEVLDKLTLGGTLQMGAFYHDISARSDANKSLSFAMHRFRVDLNGAYNANLGLVGQFLLEANGRDLGIEDAFAYYRRRHFRIRAGKVKKPFSMEALQNSAELPMVERSRLYGTFLAETNGYSLHDLGIVIGSGFEDEGFEVTYEAGLFNGLQSRGGGYAGAHYAGLDEGLKAKDFAGRLSVKSAGGLEAEAAFSTKSAESGAGSENVDFEADAAFQAGLAFNVGGLRLQGEAAWGSNHQGADSNIVNGGTPFFAFYGLLLWRRDYSGDRASETALRIEGLDPDWRDCKSDGPPSACNDGLFRYGVGGNYFFTPKVSVLANYGLLHPITQAKGRGHLVHEIDLLWRLNF